MNRVKANRIRLANNNNTPTPPENIFSLDRPHCKWELGCTCINCQVDQDYVLAMSLIGN